MIYSSDSSITVFILDSETSNKMLSLKERDKKFLVKNNLNLLNNICEGIN